MFRSSNPILNENTFTQRYEGSGVMTLQGTINKSLILILTVILSASIVWYQFYSGNTGIVMPMIITGVIGGLIAYIGILIKRTWSPFLAPVYAIFEGLLLGGVSALVNSMLHGIVIQAVGLTFGIFLLMLVLYKTNLIRATEGFKRGLLVATGAIALVYMINFILRLFGTEIPYIHEGGMIGIGFSIFVVVIASLNLILHFDFIEEGSRVGAPKYMEWYASFGLLVTLVWLYIEILNLLIKLSSSRD